MSVVLLSLRIFTTGNYVHSYYNSFTKNYKIILHITSYLLSKNMLCKEYILIQHFYFFYKNKQDTLLQNVCQSCTNK